MMDKPSVNEYIVMGVETKHEQNKQPNSIFIITTRNKQNSSTTFLMKSTYLVLLWSCPELMP